MDEHEEAQVTSFVGISPLSMSGAIEQARRELDAWHAQHQERLEFVEGGSAFQYFVSCGKSPGEFVFVITVIDVTRQAGQYSAAEAVT